MSVEWSVGSTGGIDNDYKLQSASHGSYFKYFIPTTVSGYPGVYSSVSDDRPSGNCVLNVGVSASTSFVAEYYTDSANPSQACPMVGKAAADVLKNLGGS